MKRTFAWIRSGQISDRTADGGVQPSGPLDAVTQYTSGAEIIPFPVKVVSSLPDNCGSSSGDPPFLLTFDVREIGALFVVTAVALIPWAFVVGVVFLYLTLVD